MSYLVNITTVAVAKVSTASDRLINQEIFSYLLRGNWRKFRPILLDTDFCNSHVDYKTRKRLFKMLIKSVHSVVISLCSRWLLAVILISTTASAQKSISIHLAIVSRQNSSTTDQDKGLLLEAENQSDQDVALYTPAPRGSLMRHVKYYKLNPFTNQYIELKHPLDQEFEQEMALEDSIYRATGAIVHFFGRQDYNSKSDLYQQFVRDDSLWYNYDYNNAQYAKTISETDMEHFSQVTGLKNRTALFTMMKAKERCQDFTNITFLYQQPGDYKIALELPGVDLHGSVCKVGKFEVNEPKSISSNELYLRIR